MYGTQTRVVVLSSDMNNDIDVIVTSNNDICYEEWKILGLHNYTWLQGDYSVTIICTNLYSIVLQSTMQYSTVQHSNVQYSRIQYCILQYRKVQYSTQGLQCTP